MVQAQECALVRHTGDTGRRCLGARVRGAGGAGPAGTSSRLLRPLVVSGLRGVVPVLAGSRLNDLCFSVRLLQRGYQVRSVHHDECLRQVYSLQLGLADA